jgi:hypothetical protein
MGYSSATSCQSTDGVPCRTPDLAGPKLKNWLRVCTRKEAGCVLVRNGLSGCTSVSPEDLPFRARIDSAAWRNAELNSKAAAGAQPWTTRPHFCRSQCNRRLKTHSNGAIIGRLPAAQIYVRNDLENRDLHCCVSHQLLHEYTH